MIWSANVGGGVMIPRPERDWFRRLLERLPWFDRDEYERDLDSVDRELLLSKRAVEQTRRILIEVRRVERVIGGS